MNKFIEAMTNETQTENGAVAFKSSMNKNVDLFFAGAVKTSVDEVKNLITKAFQENRLLATKVAFYLRDAREGQGKRDVVRALIQVLSREDSSVLTKILPFIPMIGRWKDVFENMKLFNQEQLAMIKKMIEVGTQDPSTVQLMAKWMPRKGENAVILTKLLGLSPKEYRQFVVSNSNTVEQLMCAKQWDEIDFEKVPSVASKIYQKAFMRNAESYQAYVNSLVKGEAKVNASTLFPHDIVSAVMKRNGNMSVLDAQWKALPDYMEGAEQYNVLPVIDTSGSMTSPAYGNVTCMDISAGLGVYLAQHNRGAFKDMWCNFNDNPTFYTLKSGTIENVVRGLDYNNWGGSTNLNKVFDKLLSTALQNKVPAEDMPRVILIVSDMEFNSCGRLSNYEKIKLQYKNSGYECPAIVFWNVSSRNGTTPVRFDEQGVALVGGYSPVIMQQILKGGLEELTPEGMMLRTVADKYNYLNGLV